MHSLLSCDKKMHAVIRLQLSVPSTHSFTGGRGYMGEGGVNHLDYKDKFLPGGGIVAGGGVAGGGVAGGRVAGGGVAGGSVCRGGIVVCIVVDTGVVCRGAVVGGKVTEGVVCGGSVVGGGNVVIGGGLGVVTMGDGGTVTEIMVISSLAMLLLGPVTNRDSYDTCIGIERDSW